MIYKLRATLDEVQDTFLKYPEVDIQLYENFEQKVIDVNLALIDRFVEACAQYDFDEMNKVHDEIIEAVIEISEKFTS